MRVSWKSDTKENLEKDLDEALIFFSDGLQFMNHVTFDESLI